MMGMNINPPTRRVRGLLPSQGQVIAFTWPSPAQPNPSHHPPHAKPNPAKEQTRAVEWDGLPIPTLPLAWGGGPGGGPPPKAHFLNCPGEGWGAVLA